MSVQQLLAAGLAEALGGHAALTAEVTAIFDAPPVRAARPYALIGETLFGDWGTKDMAGREARTIVTLLDLGERADRARRLAGEIEAAVETLPRELGNGWRVASLALLRSRVARDGEGWAAAVEHRVRVLKGV